MRFDDTPERRSTLTETIDSTMTASETTTTSTFGPKSGSPTILDWSVEGFSNLVNDVFVVSFEVAERGEPLEAVRFELVDDGEVIDRQTHRKAAVGGRLRDVVTLQGTGDRRGASDADNVTVRLVALDEAGNTDEDEKAC